MDALNDVSVISHGKHSEFINGISNTFLLYLHKKYLPDSSKPIDDQHRVFQRSALSFGRQTRAPHLVHAQGSCSSRLFCGPYPQSQKCCWVSYPPALAPHHHCRCSYRFAISPAAFKNVVHTKAHQGLLLFCVASESEALLGFFPPPCEMRPTLQTPSRELILLSRHSHVSRFLQQPSGIGSSIKIKILSTHPNSPIFNARPFHEELVPRRKGRSNLSSFHSNFVTWINIVRCCSPCAFSELDQIFFLTPQCFI